MEVARVRDVRDHMRIDTFSCNDDFLDNGQANAPNYVILAREIDSNYSR